MDAVIAKSRTTWKTNESEETNDDNKILYKPKGETKVLNRQDYIKIIKKSENDKKQEERQEKGLFTREEFIDNGIIAELSDEEETEFETSGFIPAKYLVKANKLITKYVMKQITKRLIQQDSRLTKTDGSTKNGIEIYNILRKPKSTNIKNIIYLTNRIQQVKTWKNIDYHKYAKELFKLETQRHEAIEAMNCTLPPHHIQVITEVLSRMENDPEKLPTHHAMVAIDYEELDTCDEFTDYLLQYLPTKKKRNPRNRTNNTNQHDTRTHTTNNATVVRKTKNGNILECAAVPSYVI